MTCARNALIAPNHNRVRVILPKAARDRWLDPGAAEGELRALLVPLPAEEMEAYEVSTFVNAPRNDSPECVTASSVAETLCVVGRTPEPVARRENASNFRGACCAVWFRVGPS